MSYIYRYIYRSPHLDKWLAAVFWVLIKNIFKRSYGDTRDEIGISTWNRHQFPGLVSGNRLRNPTVLCLLAVLWGGCYRARDIFSITGLKLLRCGASQLPEMESCAVHLVSHFKCNLHTSFGQIWLVYHGTYPWDVSTRWPSCHLKTATASLRRRFLCCLWWGGCPNNRALHGDVETEARHGFHVFSTYFCQVSDRSEHGRLSLTWNSCRFAGNWRFPRTAMAQWQNNLSFQSFLHRSCLRVECHVVSVSFVSLRNCGACPLVAPANHDSGHRAIRCCIFEDGDDVDRKEVKQKAAFSF